MTEEDLNNRMRQAEEDIREDQKRQQEELQQIWEAGNVPLTKPRTLKTNLAIAQDNGSTDDGAGGNTAGVIGVNPKDLVGAKKVDIALVPPTAIVEMAKCMQDGAKKYGAYNWRAQGQPVQEMTYLSAALRHLFAYIDGEDCAQDSGHSHLAHVMAGLAVLTDAKSLGNSVDNRPSKGKVGEILK